MSLTSGTVRGVTGEPCDDCVRCRSVGGIIDSNDANKNRKNAELNRDSTWRCCTTYVSVRTPGSWRRA